MHTFPSSSSSSCLFLLQRSSAASGTTPASSAASLHVFFLSANCQQSRKCVCMLCGLLCMCVLVVWIQLLPVLWPFPFPATAPKVNWLFVVVENPNWFSGLAYDRDNDRGLASLLLPHPSPPYSPFKFFLCEMSKFGRGCRPIVCASAASEIHPGPRQQCDCSFWSRFSPLSLLLSLSFSLLL